MPTLASTATLSLRLVTTKEVLLPSLTVTQPTPPLAEATANVTTDDTGSATVVVALTDGPASTPVVFTVTVNPA